MVTSLNLASRPLHCLNSRLLFRLLQPNTKLYYVSVINTDWINFYAYLLRLVRKNIFLKLYNFQKCPKHFFNICSYSLNLYYNQARFKSQQQLKMNLIYFMLESLKQASKASTKLNKTEQSCACFVQLAERDFRTKTLRTLLALNNTLFKTQTKSWSTDAFSCIIHARPSLLQNSQPQLLLFRFQLIFFFFLLLLFSFSLSTTKYCSGPNRLSILSGHPARPFSFSLLIIIIFHRLLSPSPCRHLLLIRA